MDVELLKSHICREIDDAKSIRSDSAYMSGVKDGKLGALKYVLDLMDDVV